MTSSQHRLDLHYMQLALDQAQLAMALDEVPVGAVVVHDNNVIGRGHNESMTACDPSAHAEVMALRNAALHLEHFRLDGATLYVTIEPCLMCCGTLLQARIGRLVFGAREPRTGAVVSVYDSLMSSATQHHVAITEGVLNTPCAELMQAFFNSRR